MGGSRMLWGLATPFLLAGAIIAPSSHWSPQQSSQKFPHSWSNNLHQQQQQQGLRRKSSADLQAELVRRYFALQRLKHQDQILDHHLQQPYSRVQRSRQEDDLR